jgi:copper chaperone CopZ
MDSTTVLKTCGSQSRIIQLCALAAIACVTACTLGHLAGMPFAIDFWWYAAVATVFISVAVIATVRESLRGAAKLSRPTAASLAVATLVVACFNFAASGGFLDGTSRLAETPKHQVRPDTVACIPVGGMTCSGCEHHLSEILLKVDGVASTTASAAARTVTVTLDSDRTTVQELIRAINVGTGYTASESGTTTWRVSE